MKLSIRAARAVGLTTSALVSMAAATASVGCAAAPALAAAPAAVPTRDYLNDKFEVERILDWGTRPVWSPDSKRIVFTRDDSNAGPAYEMDLATRQVRCLTCRWGAAGHVVRIYYLPDNSYLVVGPAALRTAETSIGPQLEKVDQSKTELYWMPADASLPPQPLSARAIGEIALDYSHSPTGEVRIAWGEMHPRLGETMLGSPFPAGLEQLNPKYRMLTGNIVNDGKQAFLVNRTVLHAHPPADSKSLVTFVEAYDFIDDGKSLMFYTIENGRPNSGMYKLDIASGRMAPLPTDGQHNEIHSFPDVRYGLEESNRASDPSSPYRGMSALPKRALPALLTMAGVPATAAMGERYGGKTFDLYVIDWKTNQRRRLTKVSHLGGQAHQSSPARDGKHIAFALHGPKTGPFAGKDGLYVGTFSDRE